MTARYTFSMEEHFDECGGGETVSVSRTVTTNDCTDVVDTLGWFLQNCGFTWVEGLTVISSNDVADDGDDGDDGDEEDDTV